MKYNFTRYSHYKRFVKHKSGRPRLHCALAISVTLAKFSLLNQQLATKYPHFKINNNINQKITYKLTNMLNININILLTTSKSALKVAAFGYKMATIVRILAAFSAHGWGVQLTLSLQPSKI